MRRVFGHNSPEKVSETKRRIFSLLLFPPVSFLWNAISPGRTGWTTQVYAYESRDVQVLFCHLHSCFGFFSRRVLPYSTPTSSPLMGDFFWGGRRFVYAILFGGCVKTHWITISRKIRLSFLFAFYLILKRYYFFNEIKIPINLRKWRR